MSRASKLYDKSPKMERGEDGNMSVKKSAEGEKRTVSTESAGTDGMVVQKRHAHERRETAHRHMKERMDMHHKHETEHENASGEKAEMHARHHEELKTMHTRHEKEFKEMHMRHEKEVGGEGKKIENDKGKE